MSLFSKSKSVDSILSSLTSTVAKLELHAEEQKVKAATQKAVASAAELAHKAHVAEADLAKKVAGNIKSLLGA